MMTSGATAAKRCSSAVLLTLVASLVWPAGTSVAGTGTAGRSTPLPAALAEAKDTVDAVRAAMATGRLTDLLATTGIGPPAGTHVSSGPGATSAIAELASVVEIAGDAIMSSLPDSLENVSVRGRIRHAGDRVFVPVLDAQTRASIDRAAAALAAAIDAALPDLRAAASAHSTGREVVGCDVVDQPPALCVAGEGDNVITTDYALVVDLGGADLHRNSAGAASPFDNGLPVSVTIDLGGNDRYDAPIPTTSGSWLAQGAGFLGVGFLVDTQGNDTYRIVTNEELGFSAGQGMGELGVGVLADFAGADTYELSATGPSIQQAIGQGQSYAGVGVLFDQQGDDVHRIEAVATDYVVRYVEGEKQIVPPTAYAYGLGAAQLGEVWVPPAAPIHPDVKLIDRGSYGLFADGGGNDSLDVRAGVQDPQQDEHATSSAAPSAVVGALGYGDTNATGIAVLGEGTTYASVRTTAYAPYSYTATQGIGVGWGAGLGMLSDGGGSDVWELASQTRIRREAVAAPLCPCDPEAIAVSLSTTMDGLGQGTYSSWATGFLEDRGTGTDRYVATASNVVETKVRDDGAQAPDGESSSRSGPVTVRVQGGGFDGGHGALLDEGGSDRYEVEATSVARATSSRPDAALPARATAGDVSVLAHGSARASAHGLLLDLGGSDRYSTTSSSLAEAMPATEVTPGTPTAGAGASVDVGSVGSFLDRDEGDTDTFAASPPTPACTGTRGQGHWIDCGGAGIGVMA